MEDGDIAEVMKRMARDFARRKERRDEVYKYDRREFGLWVSSVKAPRSALEAIREFDHRFFSNLGPGSRIDGGGQGPTILEVGQ